MYERHCSFYRSESLKTLYLIVLWISLIPIPINHLSKVLHLDYLVWWMTPKSLICHRPPSWVNNKRVLLCIRCLSLNRKVKYSVKFICIFLAATTAAALKQYTYQMQQLFSTSYHVWIQLFYIRNDPDSTYH